jgi:hypothetical protein
MTVSDLLARISSRELTEWMAYFDLIAERSERGTKESPHKTMSRNPDEMKDGFRALAAKHKARQARLAGRARKGRR